jgi:hypothetical protein
LRLALAEAKVQKLRAAAASTEEAAERARTDAASTEAAARDAAQVAAREKMTLEARVSELERDLGTATTDLATAGCQFTQVTKQLQVVSEEASRLRENNTKLSQDLEGEPRGYFLSLSFLTAHVLSRSDLLAVVVGARMIHTGMTAKLASRRGVERRPPQGHREGCRNWALVRAASEQVSNLSSIFAFYVEPP